ncbi:Uncharacterised protein [Candidatus Norongarragalina meridionalis]|nr:Uncharacterised protein [Candidatus Norongarragalina meridionalis]
MPKRMYEPLGYGAYRDSVKPKAKRKIGKAIGIGAGILATLALISSLKFATPRIVPEQLPAAKKTEAVQAGARLAYAPPSFEYKYDVFESHPYSKLIENSVTAAELPPEWKPFAAAMMKQEHSYPIPNERIPKLTKKEIGQALKDPKVRGKFAMRGASVNLSNGSVDLGFGLNDRYLTNRKKGEKGGVDYYDWGENAKAALKRLLIDGIANARRGWDRTRGKGSFDKLPEYQKMALTAYEYNQGHVE